MAYQPTHRAQRLIGEVPTHRRGGLKPTQKAIYHLAKPAAALDEVSNAPMTRRALARASTTKITGALAHAGVTLALSKSADPFEIEKARHRGLGPVAAQAAKVDAKVRARLVPKAGYRKKPSVGAVQRGSHAGAAAHAVNRIDDAAGMLAPVSPRQAAWWQASDAAGKVLHHLVAKSYLGGGKFVRAVELTAEERAKVKTGAAHALENGAERTVFHGTNDASGRAALAHGFKAPGQLSGGRAGKIASDKGVWVSPSTRVANGYAHTAFLRPAAGGQAARRSEGAMLRLTTRGRPIAAKKQSRGLALEFAPHQVTSGKIMHRTSGEPVFDRTGIAPEHLNGRHVGPPRTPSPGTGKRKGTYRGE